MWVLLQTQVYQTPSSLSGIPPVSSDPLNKVMWVLLQTQVLLYSLFTLPGTDSDPDQVRLSVPKMGTVTMGDLDPDWNPSLSPCNVNSFSTAQCSHRVWSPNLSR